MLKKLLSLSFLIFILAACSKTESPDTAVVSNFDLIIANGSVYDGYGGEPIMADVAISGDRIVAVGKNLGVADKTIDATGLAVAPGFINMLSWATETLIEDGSSQSDIRQGVTLEVMGEGWSMGPLNDGMVDFLTSDQGDIKFDVE